MHIMYFDNICSPLLSLILPRHNFVSFFFFFFNSPNVFCPHVPVYVWPIHGRRVDLPGSHTHKEVWLFLPPEAINCQQGLLSEGESSRHGAIVARNPRLLWVLEPSCQAQILIPSGAPQPLVLTVFPPPILQWSLNPCRDGVWRDVLFVDGRSVDSYSLLWVSALSTIHRTKKHLWWVLKAASIYGWRDGNAEGNLVLLSAKH